MTWIMNVRGAIDDGGTITSAFSNINTQVNCYMNSVSY